MVATTAFHRRKLYGPGSPPAARLFVAGLGAVQQHVACEGPVVLRSLQGRKTHVDMSTCIVDS